MFDTIGGGEILLILVVVLLLFGPKKIPGLAQSLGKGLREFRKAQQEFQQNISHVVGNEEMRGLARSISDIREGVNQSMSQLSSEIASATPAPLAPAMPVAGTAAVPDGTPGSPPAPIAAATAAESDAGSSISSATTDHPA
jgi:sec-independent protein translocase protein TatA